MTIWWCRGCGMEDTVLHTSCKACGSATQVASMNWLEDHARGDETTYELDLTPSERAVLVELLIAENIEHRWDKDTDLVVPREDEAAADAILDDVLGEESPDDLEDDDEEGEDEDEGDDEAEADEDYETMSRLYIATVNVARRRDPEIVGLFLEAGRLVMSSPAPFGVEDEIWADVQAGARNCSAALEIDNDAPVHEQLQDLQVLLHRLV